MPGKFTFFSTQIAQNNVIFDDNETRHAIGTIRHVIGNEISFTDGKGNIYTAIISAITKKNFVAEITNKVSFPQIENLSIAVGIIKSTDRMEWIVEKCTELGVKQIIFFEANNSERNRLNLERMFKIAIAGLKQSHQAWLPEIIFSKWKDLISFSSPNKYIAFVDSENEKSFTSQIKSSQETLILIGPEGDFSLKELDEAIAAGFQKVSLGNTVLRTETAALAAAAVYHLK